MRERGGNVVGEMSGFRDQRGRKGAKGLSWRLISRASDRDKGGRGGCDLDRAWLSAETRELWRPV